MANEVEEFRIRLEASQRRLMEAQTKAELLKGEIAARDADIELMEADIAKAKGRLELSRMRLKSLGRKIEKIL